MHEGTDSDVVVLARLYLQNQGSFVVRRCVQRFEAGEISAREAVRRIRRCPPVLDGAELTHPSLAGADKDMDMEETNPSLPRD